MRRKFMAVLLAAGLICGSSMTVLANGDGNTLENVIEDAAREEINVPEGDEKQKAKNANSVQNVGEAVVQTENSGDLVEISEVDANGLEWNLADGVLTISGDGVIEQNPSLVNLKERVTSIVIEEGITGIGNSAFEQYFRLEQISIPGSVKGIGEDAFYYADCLTSVSLPDGITQIQGGTFAYCRSLTEISIPNGVTKIGKGAFLKCGALASISIPESVTEIESFAFSESGLTEISIPKGITEICDTTFLHCYNLRKATIPNSVTKIAYGAFSECRKLSEITIPESVKSLGYEAFAWCPELRTVIFKGDAPKLVGAEYEYDYSYDYAAPFEEVTATVYYPAGNPTYTDEVMAAYGSGLTWEEKEMPKMSFADVTDADWYYAAADFVFSRGIMTGMNDTEFGPSVKLSRAQFATILYRMEGESEIEYDGAAFPDVADGQFYTSPVMWAKSTGIISGYEDGRFGPADEITREQMAVMMYRYANMLGLDTSAEGDMSGFPDAEKTSPFAEKEVKWAVGRGLIRGNGGMIDSQGTAERAQCATIIMRFMESYGL